MPMSGTVPAASRSANASGFERCRRRSRQHDRDRGPGAETNGCSAKPRHVCYQLEFECIGRRVTAGGLCRCPRFDASDLVVDQSAEYHRSRREGRSRLARVRPRFATSVDGTEIPVGKSEDVAVEQASRLLDSAKMRAKKGVPQKRHALVYFLTVTC